MKASEVGRPLIESLDALVSDEIEYWREEISRPWRVGGRDRPARVGRWIGVGLAVGAALAGIAAALRVERPRE